MVMQNMCFIRTKTNNKFFINSQYVNTRHADKQLVNSENCSLF